MNEQTNDLTESCINKFHELANLFREKNKQYGDKDQLANFRNGAMLQYGDVDCLEKAAAYLRAALMLKE